MTNMDTLSVILDLAAAVMYLIVGVMLLAGIGGTMPVNTFEALVIIGLANLFALSAKVRSSS